MMLWSIRWRQHDGHVTWPGSLCYELQTQSESAWIWWSSFGWSTCACISAASWQRGSAHGHACPPAADTTPLSEKSNIHAQIKTHLFLNLKHDIADLMICTCVQISENAHLTDTQLIRVGLHWAESLEHGNAVFSVFRWSILQAEQGFIPASTCDSSIWILWEHLNLVYLCLLLVVNLSAYWESGHSQLR